MIIDIAQRGSLLCMGALAGPKMPSAGSHREQLDRAATSVSVVVKLAGSLHPCAVSAKRQQRTEPRFTYIDSRIRAAGPRRDQCSIGTNRNSRPLSSSLNR